MSNTDRNHFLEAVSLVGAAGALAGAIVLVGGEKYRKMALGAFLLVLLVGFGVIGWIEAEV